MGMVSWSKTLTFSKIKCRLFTETSLKPKTTMTNLSNNDLKHSMASAKPILISLLLLIASTASAQDISSPPELGQETKGTPAIIETNTVSSDNGIAVEETENEGQKRTQFKELRSESGLIYQIELNHASGSKQYITETDSDGNIESTDNDIEETPNLPKWKIGSW